MKQENIVTGSDGDSTYAITTDASTRIMKIVERGNWNIDFAKRYNQDFTTALARFRREVGDVNFLFETSELVFVADDIAAVMLECLSFKPGDRFATVIGSTIAKLAAKRRFAGGDYGCPWDIFVTEAEAYRWLISD